jgi:2'-5' RNA ligase
MALGSSALCALAAATTLSGAAQAAENRAILTGVVDDSKLVEVAGNIRPEVRTSQDLGRIDDSTFFPHVTLVLQRSGAMEKATQDYIEAIHNKNSRYSITGSAPAKSLRNSVRRRKIAPRSRLG